jgi:lipoate-protein ligase A
MRRWDWAPPVTDVLRVIDFGRVTPLRSQTLWHAVGYGVSAGQPATLSFARPSAPYVCLGRLRDPAEVDHIYCTRHGLPVYRRMVGGGPVYLDQRQLFFQICLPAAGLSPSRRDALRMLLEPAVAAFRTVGIAASLDDGEICLGDRKICGHGAGQIGDAVVVCGNLIEAFDHERATRVLTLPDPVHRDETARLMRRYVMATPADPSAFQSAVADAFAEALGRRTVPGDLTEIEHAAMAELDRRFTSAHWLAGPHRPRRPAAASRLVKIRAGIWTLAAQASDGARVVASVVKGVLDRVVLTAPGMNGQVQAAQRALVGHPVSAATDVLSGLGFGEGGRELAAALAGAEGTA